MSLWAVYIRSLKILWAEHLLTLTIAIAGVASAVIALFEPVFFGHVIDSLAKSEKSLATLFVWAALGLFNVAMSVFVAVMADRLAHRRRLSVMGEVFDRSISLPMSYHAELGSGRVVRAILSGTDQLFTLWLSLMREQFPALISIILMVPVALNINWQLAILLFALSLFYVLGNRMVLKRTRVQQADVEVYNQDVFGRVGDVISNVTVVQSYARLVDESRALQQIMARLLAAQYPVLIWWGILNVITRVASTLTLVAILALGSFLAIHSKISVGEIVTFSGFATLLISRLDQVASFFSRTVTQAPTLMNFFALLDQKGGIVEALHAKPLPEGPASVVFAQVTYRYTTSTNGVNSIQFTAPAGKTVALVGPSGSGKTTTLALLQRLFDPQEGAILINGEDIRDLTLASLRQTIATVFQEAGLFNRSIAENIRIGRPSATDAEIEAAARLAEAHDFISGKPGGYHFVIGERGSLLSGGERQRVAIARAILKNASILILDEATSALDNETERKIQNAIQYLRQDKTTFVIAHRLSTVVTADLILVFDGGRIVEQGTFQELKSLGGLFSRLLNAGQLATDGQRYG
jgi:glucan exporter ATP-binding protein